LSRLFLTALGLGPSHAWVDVSPDEIEVRMGWGFRGAAPRDALVSATSAPAVRATIGVHGWRGDWLVNGALDGLLELRFSPPMQASTLGIPLRIERLRVSVEEPEVVRIALGGGS
jgi:hypothetical protein